MRVCIPIEFRPEGGGHYFLSAFADYIIAKGGTVTRAVTERCDVLFTSHWLTPKREILNCIRRNSSVRIVHRIDGVAQDYGRADDADERQAQVNRLADLTIFQSEYSRYASRQKYKVIKGDGPVIHNPVNLQNFYPAGQKKNLPGNRKVACVTWSVNPNKGANEMYAVAAENTDVDFFLCGNYPNAPALANLHGMGILARNDLADVLRSCDLMLTFSKNEACPNHVLEALASGLPILFDDSGAMAEVIGEAGLPVTTATFRSQLNKLYSDLTKFSSIARSWAVEKFNPEQIFSRYLTEIEGSLSRPTEIPIFRRKLIAMSGSLGL